MATYNVNGLANNVKRREIFHYLHVKNFDIMFLQEVHSTSKITKFWSSSWGNKIWFSHGPSNARGVAIMFNKTSKIQVHNVITSNDGCYLLLYCSLNKIKLLLVNIYAPNNDDPEYHQEVFREVDRFTPDHTIIAGDFNLAMDVNIDRQGSLFNNDNAAKWLKNRINNIEIVDVFRTMYPDINGFTYRRVNSKLSFSRLDYFLVHKNTLASIDSIRVLPSFKSDHSIVVMRMVISTFPRGPGYWKFNTKLLRDKDYVDRINEVIEKEIELEKSQTNRNRWELLKLTVRNTTL